MPSLKLSQSRSLAFTNVGFPVKSFMTGAEAPTVCRPAVLTTSASAPSPALAGPMSATLAGVVRPWFRWLVVRGPSPSEGPLLPLA